MKTLENKVVLITGASAGIGAAAARAFDRAGAITVMAARRTERLAELAATLKQGHPLAADLSNEASARAMIHHVADRFGRIDLLVNNAACIIVSTAGNVASADLMKAMMTNLVGPVAATQEAVARMRAQGGGQIINVGSPGFMMGIPFYAPYVCSKAAFSAWTRTIQAEWAGSGIVVSEYFPGYIKTDSRPESRIGEVEQDLLMEQNQNWIASLFTRPLTPDRVAEQLVDLALKPRTIAYSGFSVRLGAWISNLAGFRLALARQMAATAQAKKKIAIFTDPNRNPQTSTYATGHTIK